MPRMGRLILIASSWCCCSSGCCAARSARARGDAAAGRRAAAEQQGELVQLRALRGQPARERKRAAPAAATTAARSTGGSARGTADAGSAADAGRAALRRALFGRDERTPDSFWTSLRYFNIYRMAVAALFLGITLFYGDALNLGSHRLDLLPRGLRRLPRC